MDIATDPSQPEGDQTVVSKGFVCDYCGQFGLVTGLYPIPDSLLPAGWWHMYYRDSAGRIIFTLYCGDCPGADV